MRHNDSFDRGTDFLTRFQSTGEGALIDAAVDAFGQALATIPHDDPEVPRYHFNVALAHGMRQHAYGGASDADAAVAGFTTALTKLPPNSPSEAGYTFQTAVAFATRYDTTGDPADLNRAIDAYRRGVHVGVEHPKREIYRVGLATRLGERFHLTKDENDLTEAWQALCETVGATAHLPDALIYRDEAIGFAHLRLTENHTGALDDLIDVLRPLATSSPLEPVVIARLPMLPMVLQVRYEASADPADAQEAIALYRSLAAGPDGDEMQDAAGRLTLDQFLKEELPTATAGRCEEVLLLIRQAPSAAGVLSGALGQALMLRFNNSCDVEIGDLAVDALDHAVAVLPEDDEPNRAKTLLSLGVALWRRAEEASAPGDLDRAVEAARLALSLAAPPSADFYRGLAHILRQRFLQSNDRQDLAEAVSIATSARDVSTTSDDVFDALCLLGTIYTAAFDASGDEKNLTAAVDTLQEALLIEGIESGSRASALASLGEAFLNQISVQYDMTAVPKALAALSEAVRLTAPDSLSRAHRLGRLGVANFRRYEDSRDPAHLSDAVGLLRTALSVANQTRLTLAANCNDLGLALRVRSEHAGRLDDLDEAIALHRRAVDLGNGAGLAIATSLISLASALHGRFVRIQIARIRDDDSDLNDEICALERVLTVLPASHPSTAMASSHLGVAFRCRASQRADNDELGAVNDLDRSIALHEESVRTTPAGFAIGATFLTNLCIALMDRDGSADLDRAIATAAEAVRCAKANSADRIACLSVLAMGLRKRYDRTRQPADLTATMDVYRSIVAAPDGTAQHRFHSARFMGDLGAETGRYDDAIAGYSTSIELLPQLAWLGAERTDQEQLLATARGITGDAVAAALAAGHPHQAVTFLEQGRSVLWSQLVGTGTDIDDLQLVCPDLAEQLVALRQALDDPRGLPSDRRVDLAREWDRLVTAVRAVPAFERFLQRATADQIIRDIQGTAVAVNVGALRCDAIIVRHGTVSVCPLPQLHYGQASKKASAYLVALLRQYLPPELQPDLPSAEIEQVVTDTLAWLWDAVAAPVLDFLGHHDAHRDEEPWPAITWCLTGPLSALPIHAAGRLERGPGHAVLDRVVSSYTPTLTVAARKARQGLTTDTADDTMLIVAATKVAGTSNLPHADLERDLLLRRTGNIRRQLLDHDTATKSAVLQGLDECHWVHFACHGAQNMMEPSSGGLRLVDGVLTIAELARRRTRLANFAFLAACQTATGGVVLPDEAISLGAAFSHLGFADVIATQWYVKDSFAAEVADEFYRLSFSADGGFDPTTSATALHHAVRKLRSGFRSHPTAWAFFIHIGGLNHT